MMFLRLAVLLINFQVQCVHSLKLWSVEGSCTIGSTVCVCVQVADYVWEHFEEQFGDL